jgi:hypothetical protein
MSVNPADGTVLWEHRWQPSATTNAPGLDTNGLPDDKKSIAENALGLSASGTIRSYEFGVVPLFVIMGLMLDKADVGRDAFVVSCALLRKVKGGLGIATVMANAIFASITGTSIAVDGGWTAH